MLSGRLQGWSCDGGELKKLYPLKKIDILLTYIAILLTFENILGKFEADLANSFGDMSVKKILT